MPVARSKTKQNQAYQTLRTFVSTAALKPGDQLPPLRQLAKQSRTNLNAVYIAIRRLEQEGLVVTHHGRGVFIAPAAPRMRNILLLNRIQDHLWSEITQHFIKQFTANPHDRLIIELIPDEHSGQLPAFREKLKTLIACGIDTVIFNGMRENNLQHIYHNLPDNIHKLCIMSTKAIPIQNDSSPGSVVSNWFLGGQIATQHLIDINAKNLVHIMPNDFGQIKEINLGAEYAVAQNALTPSNTPAQIHRFICPNFDTNSLNNTRQLLKQFPNVDGILTYGDFVAVPLIRSLQQLGKHVPNDIAVAGYYDTPWVDLSSPTLTSVNLCCKDIIDKVVEMYLQADFTSHISIPPKLMIRQSTTR